MKLCTTLLVASTIHFFMMGLDPAIADDAMDLSRTDSRWLTVQAVTTVPADAQRQLSEPAIAWYQTVPGTSLRRVTIPGSEVERTFFADRRPVDGSFSEFVWVFDARTGHVVSASLTGQVEESIRIGPIRSSVRVAITVELSTRARGGYRAPHRLAGRTVVGYCPDLSRPGCTPVTPAAYDSGSGWVLANGAVCAVWKSLHTQAFTSLGEARFREMGPEQPGQAFATQLRRDESSSSRSGIGDAC